VSKYSECEQDKVKAQDSLFPVAAGTKLRYLQHQLSNHHIRKKLEK